MIPDSVSPLPQSKRLFGLYAISDQHLIPEHRFSTAIEQALLGGARIIQYRDKSDDTDKRLKQANAIQKLCARFGAVSIINDDIALAKSVGADGVHLGRDDDAIELARTQLGSSAIIGISCYDDIDRAITAQLAGADYVAFGTMFASSTKPEAITAGPDIIRAAKARLDIPICCIGGITSRNLSQVVEQGADMAAVISDLFSASDIKQASTALSCHFEQR